MRWIIYAMDTFADPVTLRPIPLLHTWLQRPHVIEWWGGADAQLTLAQAQAKYLPRVMAQERVTPYLAMIRGEPIGYAQSYVALGEGGGWWEDETDPGVRGTDQFLAEASLLGRGLRTRRHPLLREGRVSQGQEDRHAGRTGNVHDPGARRHARSSSAVTAKEPCMASLAHHLYSMACNNAWANHRLLAACAKLSHEELVAQRTSFFPSIKATLNHILTVDWYYLDALERGYRNESPNREAGKFFDPREPFDTLGALSIEQHAADRRLLTLCAGLTDADVDRPIPVVRRQGVLLESATRLLAHLFQHQIHHRGQVHAMLAGTSVAPPQLDEFFCANEAHLRAGELAEIGLSETTIWEPR